MSKEPSKFELTKMIDRHLAALSKLYAQEGKRQLQEIIVNAQTRIHEEWSRDNWNGGTYGHALYLVLPEPLFLSAVKLKNDIQTQIKEDLNKIHNIQNEFIEEVFMEMEIGEDHEWRKDSGLLLAGKRAIPPDATKRIWGDEGFRVFLSHKSEVKKETAELKERLRVFGISCFVAHEDIHPTKAWQDEIENALASMDGFVALMTSNFHDSDWTDQEVGFAFARGVPIIAVRLGKDPYGFIGKFQGLTASWAEAPVQIAKLLIRHERMFHAFIQCIKNCRSFDHGNQLAELFPSMENLTEEQIDLLVATYNAGGQAGGSYGFLGTKPRTNGSGLVHFLNRLGRRTFRFNEKWYVEEVANPSDADAN